MQKWFQKNVPFLLMHVAALGVFLFPFAWKWVALCFASYGLRMFAITAGYHRYFSHRTYQTNRIFQACMAALGCTAVQKGPLWWASQHRHHHRHSDQPLDLHSPVQQGFWWSHMGWIMSEKYEETREKLIPDLIKYPELRWLNRWHLVPAVVYFVALGGTWGWEGVFWGGFLSTVILFHGTATINSLSHVFGWQRYESGDQSRNNPILALITLGEGWHNNHHTFMASTRQGFFWWEYDLSYYGLCLLRAFGIVKNFKAPPLAKLESSLVQRRSKTRKNPAQHAVLTREDDMFSASQGRIA